MGDDFPAVLTGFAFPGEKRRGQGGSGRRRRRLETHRRRRIYCGRHGLARGSSAGRSPPCRGGGRIWTPLLRCIREPWASIVNKRMMSPGNLTYAMQCDLDYAAEDPVRQGRSHYKSRGACQSSCGGGWLLLKRRREKEAKFKTRERVVGLKLRNADGRWNGNDMHGIDTWSFDAGTTRGESGEWWRGCVGQGLRPLPKCLGALAAVDGGLRRGTARPPADADRNQGSHDGVPKSGPTRNNSQNNRKDSKEIRMSITHYCDSRNSRGGRGGGGPPLME